MNTFSIEAMVRFGWETFNKNKGVFVGAAAVIGIAQIISQAIGAIPLLGVIPSTVIGLFVGMGMIRFFLRGHDSASDVTVSALWNPVGFWRYFGATLLKGFIIAGPIVAGVAALVISGTMFSADQWTDMSLNFFVALVVLICLAASWMLYASARLALVEYLVLDGGKGPLEAIKTSFQSTQWAVWKIILLLLVLGLINLAGALVLLVGLLVSVPVSMLAMAHLYRTLSGAVVAAPSPAVSMPPPPAEAPTV